MQKIVYFLFVIFGFAVADLRTITLDTTVRDFKGTGQPNYDPDFESDRCGDDRGVVGTYLDADGKPYLTGPYSLTIHSAAGFAEWYRDTPGVNIPLQKSITLTETAEGSGVFYVENHDYFPIDGEGWPPGYFLNSGHNFGFTTEISTEFTYQGGEIFTFTGDDDVWVYINNTLAVDLGGCHPAEEGSVDLNAAANHLGITIGGTYSLKIFNAERHTYGSNFGVSTSLKLVPVPTNICGDGKIQSPEQCDNGNSNGAMGSCCSSNCTLLPSSFVCRPAAGECDLAESCTGSDAACPSDALKSLGTPCGESFGACDVQLYKSCTGSDAQCYGPPPAVSVLGSRFSDFTVTSFGSFNVHGGDVEGRLAVRDDAVFDSFTVGLKLTLATDGYRLITALVGGNVNWTSGSLHPDGVNDAVSISGPAAYLYVGGDFIGSASQYIDYVGNVTDIQSPFDAAQSYYVQIQSELSGLPINAMASMQYGDGLAIRCENSSDLLYHVQVDGDVLSATNWYSLSNCNFASRWVIDVTGTKDITIMGGQFPGIVERVIYNVLGQGRTINTNNGINGHIIAPQNTFKQPVGVTYGLVVAGDIPIAKQNNKPNCQNFKNVTVTTKLAVGVQAGDQIIYVVDYPSLIQGDSLCIGSECHSVQSLQAAPNKRDQSGGAIVFDAPFSMAHSAGSTVSLTVAANEDRSQVLPYVPQTVTTASASGTDFNWENDAVALSGSAFVALVAVFLY